MAFAVNKAIILGNLGKDPELRYTQTGKAVVRFTVATSERGRDGTDRTEWHNVTAWDKLAELVDRLVGKGNKVYVEGRLRTHEYTDRDGNRRWNTEIVAREMVFLTTTENRGGGPRPPGGDGGGGGDWDKARPAGGGGGGGDGGGGGGGSQPAPKDDIPYSDDEDIPF